MYTALVLTEAQRKFLLSVLPPVYPDVIAHHVTMEFNVDKFHVTDGLDYTITITNELLVDCDRNVQCLLVKVNGESRRPDGKLYHITWSIDRSCGAKPVMSNEVGMDFVDNNRTESDSISTNHVPFHDMTLTVDAKIQIL